MGRKKKDRTSVRYTPIGPPMEMCRTQFRHSSWRCSNRDIIYLHELGIQYYMKTESSIYFCAVKKKYPLMHAQINMERNATGQGKGRLFTLPTRQNQMTQSWPFPSISSCLLSGHDRSITVPACYKNNHSLEARAECEYHRHLQSIQIQPCQFVSPSPLSKWSPPTPAPPPPLSPPTCPCRWAWPSVMKAGGRTGQRRLASRRRLPR